jgi:hypothetical protein
MKVIQVEAGVGQSPQYYDRRSSAVSPAVGRGYDALELATPDP